MKRNRTRRNPRFMPESLESRLSPAVITYPLAPSMIIFDPKGDREPDPRPYGTMPTFEPIKSPYYDTSTDTPTVIVSDIA